MAPMTIVRHQSVASTPRLPGRVSAAPASSDGRSERLSTSATADPNEALISGPASKAPRKESKLSKPCKCICGQTQAPDISNRLPIQQQDCINNSKFEARPTSQRNQENRRASSTNGAQCSRCCSCNNQTAYCCLQVSLNDLRPVEAARNNKSKSVLSVAQDCRMFKPRVRSSKLPQESKVSRVAARMACTSCQACCAPKKQPTTAIPASGNRFPSDKCFVESNEKIINNNNYNNNNNRNRYASVQSRNEDGQESRLSTSCSDSDRLKEDEAEISSVTTSSAPDDDNEAHEKGRNRNLRAASSSAHRRTPASGITPVARGRWLSPARSLSSSSLQSSNDGATESRLYEKELVRAIHLRHDRDQQQAAETTPFKAINSENHPNSSVPNSVAAKPKRRRPAPAPPSSKPRSQSVGNLPAAGASETTGSGSGHASGLLNDQEVHCIEHCLKSHRSSIYVCGCMANLYFTKTHLADNGRASKAALSEWKLNKTGVPVLIFDSGLTRNRTKRRLSISLAERGSGFVLWSDTIDHLSNYRAFSARLHSIDGQSSPQASVTGAENDDTCDSFHVMYLSSNHRIMVGLSFDDSTCARLFLAQVELVCADPANIALSGPKVALPTAAHPSPLVTVGHPRKRAHQHHLATCNSRPLPVINRLIASFKCARGVASGNASRRCSPRPAAPVAAGRVSQSSQSPPSSWSTLKRAALRLGSSYNHQQHQQQQQQAVTGAGPEIQPRPKSLAEQRLLSVFRPRPLAQLAAEGKVWHRSRRGHMHRLPRKCDISAPCLFQHVTSVDLDNLRGLYSRSFVGGQVLQLAEVNIHPERQSDQQLYPSNQQLIQEQPQQVMISARTNCSSASQSSGEARLNAAQDTKQKRGVVHESSSTSSCYSTGSSASSSPRSPASSDCDIGEHLLPAQQPEVRLKPIQHGTGAASTPHRKSDQPVLTRRASPSAAARPPVPPPKPPQRRDSVGASNPPQTINSERFDRDASSAGAPLEAGSVESESATRISSIIRELQAQVPGDLVNAKRRLMADIAGQALRSRQARTGHSGDSDSDRAPVRQLAHLQPNDGADRECDARQIWPSKPAADNKHQQQQRARVPVSSRISRL